jgi:hypothetical protein
MGGGVGMDSKLAESNTPGKALTFTHKYLIYPNPTLTKLIQKPGFETGF